MIYFTFQCPDRCKVAVFQTAQSYSLCSRLLVLIWPVPIKTPVGLTEALRVVRRTQIEADRLDLIAGALQKYEQIVRQKESDKYDQFIL
nr:unnamed protein product [Callosobruchus chinensis]